MENPSASVVGLAAKIVALVLSLSSVGYASLTAYNQVKANTAEIEDWSNTLERMDRLLCSMCYHMNPQKGCGHCDP